MYFINSALNLMNNN